MDDPITSFDNERMTLFINILKEFDKANQIIILTHYADFYKKIVDLMYAVQPLPALLKIQPLTTTNKIIKVDKQTMELIKLEEKKMRVADFALTVLAVVAFEGFRVRLAAVLVVFFAAIFLTVEVRERVPVFVVVVLRLVVRDAGFSAEMICSTSSMV